MYVSTCVLLASNLLQLFNVVPKEFGGSRLLGPHRLQADSLGYVNQHGLSRKHIFAGVKASLERLQLDYIDVLQCHRLDPDTPIPEIVSLSPS